MINFVNHKNISFYNKEIKIKRFFLKKKNYKYILLKYAQINLFDYLIYNA